MTQACQESQTRYVGLEFTSYQEDPHTVSGLLKLFLRQLPEPLIPAAVNKAVSAIFASGTDGDIVPNLKQV